MAETHGADAPRRACAGDLEALASVAPGIVLVAQDAQCRVVTGNRAARELLGQPTGAALAWPPSWRVFAAGRELPPAEWPLERAARGEQLCGNVFEVVLPDGTLRTLCGSAAPLLDGEGRPRGAVAALCSVAPQRVAEAQAQGASSFAEETPSPVLRATAAGGLLYANPPATRMLRAAGWCEGRPLPEPLWAGVRRVLRGGQTEELDFEAPEDRAWAVVVAAGPDGSYASVLGHDVTALRRSEAQLRAAATRLQETLAILAEGHYTLDHHWRFLTANETAERHFGLPISQLRGQNIWTYTDVPTHAAIRRHFEAARATRCPVRFEIESRLRPGYWAEVHVLPRPDVFEVYFTTITERRQREQSVRDSEQRLRSLLDAVPSPCLCSDGQGRLTYLNPAAEARIGVPVSELLGRTLREAGLPEEACEPWEASIARVCRTAQTCDVALTLSGPRGPCVLRLTLAPERAGDGTVGHVLGVSTDAAGSGSAT